MEMPTHYPSKRGSMEEEDRLSSLPDDLLHSILRELPFKHAVRTSALSRRWAPQWLRALASSRVLDFTDPDLARGQLPARAAAATMRRCLELHAEHGGPLDVFRVALRSPPAGAGSSDGAFERDVVGWIASAVARGATEVEADLTPTPTPTEGDEDADDGSSASVELPGDLFVARNSLARLALGGPGGLAGLRSLSLSHADFTGEAFRDVVSSCRALEHLSVSSCDALKSIRIASETLRVLEMVRCRAVRELRVSAPALESLAFHGDIFLYDDYVDDGVLSSPVDMGSTPALRDVYLSQIGFGHNDDERYQVCGCDAHAYDYADLLSCVAHASVCTLSSDGWFQGNEWDGAYMTNIQELQLLMTSVCGSSDDLEGFAGLFEQNRLRLLDRLFVRVKTRSCEQRPVVTNVQELQLLMASVVVDFGEKLRFISNLFYLSRFPLLERLFVRVNLCLLLIIGPPNIPRRHYRCKRRGGSTGHRGPRRVQISGAAESPGDEVRAAADGLPPEFGQCC
ncbi:hypothetical protein SORBI_3003G118600 [Sorghum bicolor]|uniref:F-box domain-containing protein n=1 Tax=Sorghum bicolor TaxID=4558 RepID=A0A1W0VWX7_SORBI|nr:hypothetical protein SORBI_3003G118600 [Sorghum bicolor]